MQKPLSAPEPHAPAPLRLIDRARLGVALAAVALTLAGCALLLSKRGDLRASLATWNHLKAENGDHYRYEVGTDLVFGPSTTLTVQNGQVVQRDLATTEINDDGKIVVVDRWSETGAALGSHDDGAELLTVDTRYSRCREVLRRNAPTKDITLEFRADGVLASCYAVPENVDYDGGAEVITGLEFPPFNE